MNPLPEEGPAFNIVAVSLNVASADFIVRQGRLNLFLTLAACGLLLAVTFYYLPQT